MPSPFPGMDPFVEMQEWDDFHPEFISELRAQLAPRIEPKYYVRIEKRIYVEQHENGDGTAHRPQQWVPDVAVLSRSPDAAMQWAGAATATMAAPEECVVPLADERREYYLLIRGTEAHEVVTLLELISPTNKRIGADGRDVYLRKRSEVLDGATHFAELDLIRGGQRLPLSTKSPLECDYYALVSRANRRPRADLYRWSLRQPMPTISIPLAKGDPDVPLDLQAAFTNVYQRTRYDLSLNYAAPLDPPPAAAEEAWLREIVALVSPEGERQQS